MTASDLLHHLTIISQTFPHNQEVKKSNVTWIQTSDCHTQIRRNHYDECSLDQTKQFVFRARKTHAYKIIPKNAREYYTQSYESNRVTMELMQNAMAYLSPTALYLPIYKWFWLNFAGWPGLYIVWLVEHTLRQPRVFLYLAVGAFEITWRYIAQQAYIIIIQ